MQINAINPNFTGRGDNIDAFVNLDDDSVRKLAYIKTSKNINHKRYKRQSAALDMALPVAGGLSAAAFAEKGARLATFGAGFGSWALFLTGMGALFGLEKYAVSKSDRLDNFKDKHPFLFFMGSAIAAFAAGSAAMKYGIKGVEKLVTTNTYSKFADKAKGIISSVKSKPFVKKASDYMKEKVAKTPSAIKEALKVAARWSPYAVIFGSLSHDISVSNRVNAEYYANYADLKERQLRMAQYKLREAESPKA